VHTQFCLSSLVLFLSTNNALVERSFLNLKKVKIQSLLYRVQFGKKYSAMILLFFDVTVGIV